MLGLALWKTNKTCRLCLINGAKVCIFENKHVLKNIMTFCKLEVLKNDGLPSFICDECILKVEDITKFITQCRENEKILWSNLNLHNEHETDILLGNNQTETFGSDDITNFDSECDLEIPDKLHFTDDDEKKLMDSIQVSENGEEFLYYAGIKIIVNRARSEKRAIATKNIMKKYKGNSTLCPICGKFTKSLNTHLEYHGDRKYKCDICSKAFKLKEQIKNHMVAHSDVRNVECTKCSKKFKTHHALRKHTLSMHNMKHILYPCNVCNKNFKRTGELKMHMRIHTGEKNYQCSYCDNKFTYKNALKFHIRVHTGEKPYTCKYCDKCFAISKSLKDHERLHTGEKPYECPVCDKGFQQLSNMKSHFRNNHKGVEFKRKPLVRS